MCTIKYDKSVVFSDLKQTNQVLCVFTAQKHEVCGLHRLQAAYRLMTTDNLVKHGFLSTLDVCLMHGTNGTFLPSGGGGQRDDFFSVWLLDKGRCIYFLGH